MAIRFFSSWCVLCSAVSIGVLCLSGCDQVNKMNEDASKPNEVSTLKPGTLDDKATPPEKPSAGSFVSVAPVAAPPANSNPAAANSDPAANSPGLERATSGVGVQGSGYGGGIITEPVHEYFAVRDRITFDIQIPKQMQLWKAEHNNRNPKDFAEFKKEILDPCQVDLPDLPPGKRYLYDPKSGELLVASGGQVPKEEAAAKKDSSNPFAQ
jgi:hypothetical protein